MENSLKFDLSQRAVRLSQDRRAVEIIDQTLLPGEVKYLSLRANEELWEAVYSLRVRGAPAIGIFAAYAMYVAARGLQNLERGQFVLRLMEFRDYLASARPTAVNLFWALDRVAGHVNISLSPAETTELILREAEAIDSEDNMSCRSIGEHAQPLLRDGMGILTHCNAGRLATGGYGTALAPIYVGMERGLNLRVFADETRPLLQGARLTSFELQAAGVDVTLICDNMAATVMKSGLIDAVFVGSDRIAANGDAANKIGTLGVAIIAKKYDIPFYVCAPTSTIDPGCADGSQIEIELRSPSEITEQWYQNPMAPPSVKVYNPAFDVTDNSLITAIITERGIIKPPFDVNLK